MTTHHGATDVSSPSFPSAGSPTAAPVEATGAGGTMTPGSAITVASSIVIFVIIATGLLSVQYCFDAWDRESLGAWSRSRRRRRRGDDGTAGSNGATRTLGVDPELLRALPVTVYRVAPGFKGDAVECSVCLAELQDGEEARFLPRCGHGFHAECVDMWLASHTTCPLCRLTVSKPDPVSSRAPVSPTLPLRPLPPEPANLLGSVLVGVSDLGAVTTANMATDDGHDTAASTGVAAALVIQIPELTVPTPTPRDAAKSPVLAKPRSFRRLWSFGRQGPSTSSSCCTCGGAGEVADVEQGVGVTIGAVAVSEAQPPSKTTAGAGICRVAMEPPPDVRQAD